MSKIKKPKKSSPPVPFFSECVKVYFDFIELRTGFKPAWGATDGKVMKDLIKWLEANKTKELEPPRLLQIIFDHYDYWEAYHKKRLKINQIYSEIINIVNHIKNAKRINDNSKAQQHRERKAEIRERAAGLGNKTSI